MSETTPLSGIEVTTGFQPMAFVLNACTTRLQIDGGQPILRPWGQTFIPMPPGVHSVRCWFRYSVYETAGDATVTVEVPAGQIVSISYRAPGWMFRPGKWQVLGAQEARELPAAAGPTTAAAPQPGWYADPSGRHQLRFWNGADWTEHVSDNGVASVEPV